MTTNSVPYHCRKCIKPAGCGYHGILAFVVEGKVTAPTCDHHKRPGKQCHDEAERMVPVGV
jgi:hypothetical protein